MRHEVRVLLLAAIVLSATSACRGIVGFDESQPWTVVDGGNQGATGVANAPCPLDNAYACAGRAQQGVLSCNPTTHVWTPLPPCAGHQICDATPGPNQGSCQDPAAGCVGKPPGDKFCMGTQSVTCGPDLLPSAAEPCPKGCVGNGQCAAGLDAGPLPEARDASGTPVLIAISFAVASTTVPVGGTFSSKVTGRDANGIAIDVTSRAVFTSADATVADLVGPVATGRAEGTTTLTAALGDLRATMIFVVDDRSIVSLAVTSTNSSCGIGQQRTFYAVAETKDGSRTDVTSRVRWTSSNPVVVALGVPAYGICLSTGAAVITAAMAALQAQVKIEVNGPALQGFTLNVPPLMRIGDGAHLGIVMRYADGTTLSLDNIATWESSDGASLSLDRVGFARAVGLGTAVVTAKLGDMAVGTATVDVTNAKLSALEIVPNRLAFDAPAQGHLTAVGHYDNGRTYTVSDKAVWEADSDLVVVDEGVVTPHGIGSVQVTAVLDGVQATGEVTVGPGTPDALFLGDDISPSPRDVPQELGVTAHYANGGFDLDFDVTEAATWHVADASIAVIDAATTPPYLIGKRTGTTTFYATLGTTTSEVATVTVTSAVLRTFYICQGNVSLSVEETFSFLAVGTYDDGTQWILTQVATWKTGNAGIATVLDTRGSKGTATGVRVGTTIVTATFGGMSATTGITVVP